jgi:hypothetical protein
VTYLEDGFKAIYGANINLDGNSPDAQMINLFAQAKMDLLEIVANVYASFDPNQANGVVLDQRVTINGIKRLGATTTRTYVDVTTDRIITLPGKDTSNNPFTISDGSGTKFSLEATTTTISGLNSLIFSAVETGIVQTIIGALTTIETITLGVITVNNSASPFAKGVNEETDVQLRARRQISVSLSAVGAVDATQAAISNLAGVTDAIVYENTTSDVDVYGTNPHSIWAVVDGGDSADIANAIYAKRNAGCGMRGEINEPIVQLNGLIFMVHYDRPIYQNLYISIEVTSLNINHTIDSDALKNAIYDQMIYKIFQPADFTAITSLIKTLDPYAVVTNGGVSITNSGFAGFVYPSTKQNRFILSLSNINITVV